MLTQEPDKKLKFFNQEFKQFYNIDLKYSLAEAEKIRKKYIKSFCICSALLIADIAAFILYIVFAKFFSDLIGEDLYLFFFWALILLAFTIFTVTVNALCKYQHNMNILVLNKLITFFKKFKPDSYRLHVLPEDIVHSLLFHNIAGIKNQELFCGTYNSHDICASLSKVIKDGIWGAEWWFNGTMIMLGLNKRLPETIVIRSKKFYWNNTLAKILMLYTPIILGLIIIFSILISSTIHNQPVEVVALALGCSLMSVVPAIYFAFYGLSKLIKHYTSRHTHLSLKDLDYDHKFAKKWNVYCLNKKFAADFLSPSIRKKLLALQSLCPLSPLDCSRFDDNFILAFYSLRGFFRTTPFFVPLLNYNNLYNQTYKLYLLFDLLEETVDK